MDPMFQDQDNFLPPEEDFVPLDFFDKEDRITFLNSYDYNLNSPLLSDDVEYLIKRCQGNPVPLIWRNKRWDDVLKILESYSIDWILPTDHHSWFANWIEQLPTSVREAETFLGKVDRDSEETFIMIKSFLEGWVGESPCYPSRLKPEPPSIILSLLQKFLDLHRITLMMNQTGPTELEALIKRFKWMKHQDGWSRKFPSIGHVIICQGFLIAPDDNLVVDRNFMLMIKDTTVARLQTMVSMMGRLDDKFKLSDIEKMTQFYKIGDEILSNCGNRGYDILKMVEPICNLRLTQLAREYRPLIPDFPEFKRHVETTIHDFCQTTVLSQELYAFICSEENVEMVLTYYGAFRHWGHPYICYKTGLQKLHDQVTMPKTIDKRYAAKLASDLAKMVLHKMFQEHKRWYVTKESVPHDHPFYHHVHNCTWPTGVQIQDFGDHWHELPLTRCFEIPDLIDPSIIYADKSHSMDRSAILQHVSRSPYRPIPTLKVMKSVIDKPATNWPEFLQEVNDYGLTPEDLVIGLKAKERELKTSGRFFSLMSWRLREYFVITEYLIKTHFVPLFHGLTMADDLTSVMKKMMDTSSGQGRDDYTKVTIANHIDYEKWNNHQRGDANNPVFRVMGQFLGYPNLISRTHEFFEKSLIYYNQRPDLMAVVDGTLVNKTNELVCWNGQAGGLEGLRQKGWSIVNLLVIARESRIRNTSVKTLAQGDNQVICTHYKLRDFKDETELRLLLEQIKLNNEAIMRSIEEGTHRLGLLINKDETIQSADYLNYGKVPIFRGLIRGLECKRWSRVTCVTNDQLPTCANLMSSVSTNALTVAHFDVNPLNAMNHFNFFGNFVRLLMEMHNPAMRTALSYTNLNYKTFRFKMAVLYLDPSIGGVCGTALSRFLIRSFPDPVTESLSFWKFIHDHTADPQLRELACDFGNPRIALFRPDHIEKLLEDPTSLNIAMGMSPSNLIKTKIKENLVQSRHTITNEIIRDAVIHIHQDDEELRNFLWSIDPLFPRFLSEFKSGTFMGVAAGVVSLFQNSRTVRAVFRKKMSSELDRLIYDSELSSLLHLCGERTQTKKSIWSCSSSHADYLRRLSWGRPVIGTTIPHPLEMHGRGHRSGGIGLDCPRSGFDYISVHCLGGLKNALLSRGSMAAYIGSKTSESTSILQPWERDTKIPLIKRATRLRDAIHWFIDPHSNLALSIMNNLSALTGEKWATAVEGFKRTGSALHRFTTTRMSHGGFAAQSPACLTRLLATTDTMRELNHKNYDFMYQASLLYSQMSVTVEFRMSERDSVSHFHISCPDCLREIQEPTLESNRTYCPRDVSTILTRWKNSSSEWGKQHPKVNPMLKDWTKLKNSEKSFHLGRAISFLFGELVNQSSSKSDDSSIFPLSIQHHIRGGPFLSGMLDGLVRASACQVVHRRTLQTLHRPANALYGGVIYLIDKISASPQFGNLCRAGPLRHALDRVPHKIPPSYPTSNSDMGLSIRTYFGHQCKKLEKGEYNTTYPDLWIFSDTATLGFAGPFALSTHLVKLLYQPSLNKTAITKLRSLSLVSSALRSEDISPDACDSIFMAKLFLCTEEIRHAAKMIPVLPPEPSGSFPKWGLETSGSISKFLVTFAPSRSPNNLPLPPRIQDPLISGLRLGQLPTGAHYKVRSLIRSFNIHYRDFICGGDGSGGMTAALMRMSPLSRCIFNSLLIFDDVSMRGSSPDPPSALETIENPESRCVNYNKCWEDPSDLSIRETWECFLNYKRKYKLNINLMVFDMEANDPQIPLLISKCLRAYASLLMDKGSTVIFKTYGTILSTQKSNPLTVLGPIFDKVYLTQTMLSSSHTSEIYLVCSGLSTDSHKCHPIWDDMSVWWEGLYAFQSNQDEFERAQKVRKLNLLSGIPRLFLPDEWQLLRTLLQIANVPGGVSYTVTDLLSCHKIKPANFILALMGVISYYSIDHIRLSDELPNPPSDGVSSNMASALMGLGFAYSIIYGGSTLYDHLLLSNNTAVAIRISIQANQNKYSLNWSTKGSCRYAKDCRMASKQANIGQWIRLIIGLYPTEEPLGKINKRDVERIFQLCSSKLTLASIRRKTGVIQILQGDLDSVDLSVPTAIAGTKESQDHAWRGDF
nr:MAG: RNA-dependent RNA polymerase [Vesiculovirus yinshui]